VSHKRTGYLVRSARQCAEIARRKPIVLSTGQQQCSNIGEVEMDISACNVGRDNNR
jgi:hypothetical protein